MKPHHLVRAPLFCLLPCFLAGVLSLCPGSAKAADTTPPTIVSAAAVGNNSVRVSFSEAMDPASTTNLSNYVITNLSGTLALTAAAFGVDAQTIYLSTATMDTDVPYTLTVNGVRDASANANLIAPNSQIAFTNQIFILGYIRRQLYFNIGTATDIPSLTNSAKFINNKPDQVDYPTSMGWPVENIADGYGGRMAGYLVPALTGTYVFAIRSDDNSQLVLSTDDQPAHGVLLTYEPGCCEGFDAHVSAPVSLVAGQHYYIEALMKEGGGADYLYVAWKTPDNPGSWVVIPGAYLGNYFNLTNSTLAITQQPTNTTGIELLTATFYVTATGRSDITTNLSYQWQLNGVDIAGANGSSYTTPLLHLTDSGSLYRVLVSVPGKRVISSNAVVSVVPDTTPPTLVSGQNFGTTNLNIIFSEPVDPASATNPSNYSFTNGITVSAAVFGLDARTIVLTTSPLAIGSAYTVFVSHIRDVAATPNTIAPNSSLTFTTTEYAPQDIGGPAQGGSFVAVSNGFNVVGGGGDIGGFADQFQYSYKPFRGDFDVQVQIPVLNPSDVWAKAGLMARENIYPNARFAAVFATPGMVGSFFEYRSTTGGNSATTGSFPPNFPQTWLRLQRVGDLFTGYASYDGQAWAPLGSVTLPNMTTVDFGLAVTSHNTNQTTLAQFRNIYSVTNGVVATVMAPAEMLGACSRRTGLVISEIMYKPAPRTDGNNLEYIELYNSNPFYEDISGYKIAGDLSYTFPAGTILRGGGFLVIAASPSSVQTVYGISNVTGPYAGTLGKSGTIQLTDNLGAIFLEIPYSNLAPWPVAADGTGHSIVLARPSFGGGDGNAWAISDVAGGSPGGFEAYRPSPLRNVVINEILANSGLDLLDYVELYNHSGVAVDVSGCTLTDDASTNKFVIGSGTTIPASGFIAFDQNQLGFALQASGETVFFKNPDGSRVLDAVRFEGQSYGVSCGRWPNGAKDWYPLSARTPGGSNAPILIRDIVINEIMYRPISNDDDDQYVELYNKGSNAVNLGGWTFSAGIAFTFPANTILASNSYLVVARNMTNLFAHYPNLNAGNTVGDYAGKLPHGGGRLALAKLDSAVTTNGLGGFSTNTFLVVVDEVTYDVGGRWGQWAHGGGSSLELINPNPNHRLAYNWADSDESSKSSWTNLEFTGLLDNGQNYTSPLTNVQVGLLDVGECLVDNVEVRPGTNGANYLANSTFESGLNSWVPQGSHIRSGLETNGGYNSAQCLHIRNSDRVWTMLNSVQGSLTNTSLASGQTATLRLKARWLRGSSEILLRTCGNWIELSGAMPVPVNLGTPGLPNSRAVTNAGPAIYEVTHTPALPQANQAVVVTARFHDVAGFQANLLYRIDTGVNTTPTYTSVPMVDDGTGGDVLAGDGVYSATIPGQPGNTFVAFLVQAQDSSGASTIFPSDLHDNSGLPRECVVGFGDAIPGGSFDHQHVFMTQNWVNRWANLGGLANENEDGTFVDGLSGRVIYNWVGRPAGSPYHQYTGSPVTTGGGQHWTMPDDDLFLGTTSFNKQHMPGNGPLDDDTIQREQTSYWMARQLGLPWAYRRYYVLYVNGSRHGPLMEDSQVPNADLLKEHWPNDNNGWLYKNNGWFEGDTTVSGGSIPFVMPTWCLLGRFTTSFNGVTQYKQARYRCMYWMRQSPSSANDFTNVYALIDAANIPTSNPDYYNKMEALVDTEEWMRMSAMEHATGDWDSFFTQNQWNMYVYKPAQGKWTALKWDWNITLGGGTATWGPDGSQLFNVGANDAVMGTFQNYLPYRRAYLRAFQDIANLAMNNTYVDPVLDAKYAAFVANGLTTTSYGITVNNPGASGGLKTWIATMHNSLLAALASQGVTNVPFAPATNSITTSNNLITITGTAPVEVKTLQLNGVTYPVTWTSAKAWSLRLVVNAASNFFTLQGYDRQGNLLPNATSGFSVIYTGLVVPAQNAVVINEIMYNPAVPGAQFVELVNTSSNFTFDVSNWRMDGLGYTFPTATVLTSRQYWVLARNQTAFAAAYGAAVPVNGLFAGTLPTNSGTLTLVQPGASPAQDLVIDKVRYENTAPWPSGANGSGSSLQLIDASQDNARVSNWGDGTAWRLASITGTAGPTSTNLLIFPQTAGEAYLDDITLVPLSGPLAGSNLVQNGDFEHPLSGTWTVPASMGRSGLSSNYAHSGSSSLHVVATNGGSLANNIRQTIPPLSTNTSATLSFWYLPMITNAALTVLPYSSIGMGLSVNTRLFPSSPGSNNTLVASLPPYPPLWLNEVQADNVNGLADSAGQHDPWMELYNAGTNVLALDGYYLANNYTNLAQWTFPTGTVINPGEFKVIFADGETNEATPTELHTSFRLSSGSGSVVLSRPYSGAPQVLDYLNYTGIGTNHSYGSFPDGQPSNRQELYYVTPGGANSNAAAPVPISINEWMAANTATLVNTNNGYKYDDWFELYNSGPNPVNLAGDYLTDALANKFLYQIPAGYTIPAGGYLLVWADNNPGLNSPSRPDLHVNFRLSKQGSVIGLYSTNGTLIDLVSYGPQVSDVSMGRCPDAAANIISMSTPSPRASNVCPVLNRPPVLAPIGNQFAHQGQTLTFTAHATDSDVPAQTLTYSLDAGAPASAGIGPGSGLFTWPTAGVPAPSARTVTVRVTDNGFPPLSASETIALNVVAPLDFSVMTLSGHSLSLSWGTAPGQTYRLQYKASLSDPTWLTYGTDLPATGGSLSVTNDLTGVLQRFYRITVVQ